MLPSIYSPEAPFTLGILGGGQLAKMTLQAVYRMGMQAAIIENGENSPAGMMTQAPGWTPVSMAGGGVDGCAEVQAASRSEARSGDQSGDHGQREASHGPEQRSPTVGRKPDPAVGAWFAALGLALLGGGLVWWRARYAA